MDKKCNHDFQDDGDAMQIYCTKCGLRHDVMPVRCPNNEIKLEQLQKEENEWVKNADEMNESENEQTEKAIEHIEENYREKIKRLKAEAKKETLKIKEKRKQEKELNLYLEIGKIPRKKKCIDYKNNIGKFIITNDIYDKYSFLNICLIFKNMIIRRVTQEENHGNIIGTKYLAIGPMFRHIIDTEPIPYYRFMVKHYLDEKTEKRKFKTIFLECEKNYYYE